jgi:hypothetical protein
MTATETDSSTTHSEVVDEIIKNLRELVRSDTTAAVDRLQKDIEEAIDKAADDLKAKLTPQTHEGNEKEK